MIAQDYLCAIVADLHDSSIDSAVIHSLRIPRVTCLAAATRVTRIGEAERARRS
jgi:hypothetical protein